MEWSPEPKDRIVPRIPPPDQQLRLIIDSGAKNEIDDQWAIALAILSHERFQIEGLIGANFDNQRSGPDGVARSVREIEGVLEKVGIAGRRPDLHGSHPTRYQKEGFVTPADPIDLRQFVTDGHLFRPPDDNLRVEAYIPSMGRENHAANLAVLPDGDLLCAWFAGSAEGTGDVRIALSRLPCGSAQWTPPVWVSTDQSRSEQNPVLFPTPGGALWLIHTAQETRGCTREEWQARVATGQAEGSYGMQWTSEIRRRISRDGGHSWGPTETLFSKPGAFCRQPVRVLADGTWLLPMYYSVRDRPAHGGDYTVMQRSEDEGRTWEECPVPGSRGRVQACPIELAPGNLVAFFRSRAADRIYVSRSADAGRTWTAPERTVLPNNNASIQATRLASGAIALVYNAYSASDDPDAIIWPRIRYPLTVAFSEDGGLTWPYRRHVDPGDGFCGEANEELNRRCAYPTILQTADDAIHIAYSYRGRQCCKYVRVDEHWIRTGLATVYGGPAD